MEITPTSVWQKGRLVFKAVFIGILTLLLLIPMAFISNIVTDREQRQKEDLQQEEQVPFESLKR